MSDCVYFCPGCKLPFVGSRYTSTGQLLDCPRCRLLFAPAAWGQQTDDEAAAASRKASGYRRRFRGSRPLYSWVGLIAGVLILAVAWFAIERIRSMRMRMAGDDKSAVGVDQTAHRPASDVEIPVPPPDVSGEEKSTSSSERLAKNSIIEGEWEASDEPLEGITSGHVFAIALSAPNTLTLRSRLGLEVTSTTGQWRHSGSTLTLQFAEAGDGKEVNLSAELLAADRMRLTAPGQRPVEFNRTR